MAGAVLPAWIAGVWVHPPQTRSVHIEAYRGDRLRLTFSTRDTGQSFLFQDYDLHVSITPGNRLVSVQRLSRPDDPPALRESVEIVAGLAGWPGWLTSMAAVASGWSTLTRTGWSTWMGMATWTHLISLEAADMNGDGKPGLVSVRMDVYQPFTKDGRVVLWLNHWGQASKETK